MVEIKKIKKWLGAGSINIFGLPFAGKDTQCQMLADILYAEMIGGGDIIRNQGSKQLRRQTDVGFLAPTEEFRKLVLPFFDRDAYRGYPLILSSIGRWAGEEEPVMDAAKAAGHTIKAVIFIRTELDEIWSRWSVAERLGDRGTRYDDAKEKLDIRIREFNEKTVPVLDFYRNKRLLIEVDGTGSKESVTQQILKGLTEFIG